VKKCGWQKWGVPERKSGELGCMATPLASAYNCGAPAVWPKE